MATAKTILVTGGNRGIGYGTVVSLAMRSSTNTIIIATRQRANAQKAIDGLQAEGWKGPFHPLALDVTDDESIRSAVREVDEKFGKLDGRSSFAQDMRRADKDSVDQQFRDRISRVRRL